MRRCKYSKSSPPVSATHTNTGFRHGNISWLSILCQHNQHPWLYWLIDQVVANTSYAAVSILREGWSRRLLTRTGCMPSSPFGRFEAGGGQSFQIKHFYFSLVLVALNFTRLPVKPAKRQKRLSKRREDRQKVSFLWEKMRKMALFFLFP